MGYSPISSKGYFIYTSSHRENSTYHEIVTPIWLLIVHNKCGVEKIIAMPSSWPPPPSADEGLAPSSFAPPPPPKKKKKKKKNKDSGPFISAVQYNIYPGPLLHP